MAVYPNGELHVFANGQDVGTPWSNLPTDTPLYGVVGLENDGVYGIQVLHSNTKKVNLR